MIPLGPNTLVAKPHIRREWQKMSGNGREWVGYHRDITVIWPGMDGNGREWPGPGYGREWPEMSGNGQEWLETVRDYERFFEI